MLLHLCGFHAEENPDGFLSPYLSFRNLWPACSLRVRGADGVAVCPFLPFGAIVTVSFFCYNI